MNEVLLNSGYPALFFLSFSASTLLPIGSEWLLVALILKGFSPPMTVAVATVGNYFGACTTYWIGVYGSPVLVRKVLRIGEAARERAVRYYGRYGVWSLLVATRYRRCTVSGWRVLWSRFPSVLVACIWWKIGPLWICCSDYACGCRVRRAVPIQRMHTG
jgi:membrane protein YqaA with SNARE-associated domain